MKSISAKLSENFRKCYEIFYSAALCIGIILLSCSLFSLSYPPLPIILFSLILQFFIHWSEEKKFRIQFWLGSVVLLGLIGLFIYTENKNITLYLYYLGIAAITVPVCIVCYLARQRLWLKASICLLILISLIVFSIQKITLHKWAVCLILFCLLLFLAEFSSVFSEGKYGQKVLYLSPFFFVSILLLFLLPVKATPIRWTTVKNVIKAVREELTSIAVDIEYLFSSGNGSYSLSFAGYNESGELKGNLFSSDNTQLSIVGDQTKGPLYLAGNIYDYFNGHGWETHATKKPYEKEEYLFQYEGLMSAFSQSIYSDEEISEFTNISNYNISFKGLKTKSLFLAPLTQNVILFEERKPPEPYGDTLHLSKAQGVGYSYRIHLTEVNYTDERVKQLLRGNAWNGTPTLSEQAALRQEYIYKNYTILPKDLPERVYTLADEITANENTDYDRLKAIEYYLSNFTYTTSPEPITKDVNVIDHFLFQSQTGYCTYFASAMAILGRCEGIPTRYVEGFISNGSYHYNDRDLNLSGNNAHAWVEAYIDNIGWVPFEPTPRYYEATNTAWKKSETGKKGITAVQPPPHAPETPPSLPPQRSKEINYSSLIETGKKVLFVAFEGLLILIAGVSVIILLLFIRSRIWHHKYISGTNYEKIQFHLRKAFQFGKLYGYPIDNGETLSDYGNRTGNCLNSPENSFLDICDLFQSIRFGGYPITEATIKTMENYTLSLQKQYLKQCGRMKHLLYYMRPTQ